MAEALEDPHLGVRDMIMHLPHPTIGEIRVLGSPVKMSGTPKLSPTAPPLLGQHNRDVYCGLLGLSVEELEELRAGGVV